jgi:hypothetical protein
MTARYANPFHTWAELTRGLRDRLVAELRGQDMSPYAGELLGSLAALVTHCEHLGESLERLEGRDPQVYAAFLRALEKSV